MELNRLAYLLPTYTKYRITVLDKLFERIGNGFTVVTLKERFLMPEKLALYMGRFPRRIVGGKIILFEKEFKEGKGNSARALLTPELPGILKSLKPQLVLTEAFSTWTITATVMNYPTVIYWEGTHHTERNIKAWKNLIRQYLTNHAKAFIVNGHLSKQYLMEKFGVAEERIFAGGLCAEPPPADLRTLAEARRSLNSPRHVVRFIFCGQLVQRKGLHHLLSAAALLQQRPLERDFQITVLGGGADRHELEQQAADLGLADKVFFKGFVQPDETWHHYAESDVFVLPTLHDNWPLVVPEAMSMSLPILLSQQAGNAADLVLEGENGFTFEPTHHAQLADLMARYVQDPTLIAAHGKRSAELVARYNPSTAADVYMQAIAFAVSQM